MFVNVVNPTINPYGRQSFLLALPTINPHRQWMHSRDAKTFRDGEVTCISRSLPSASVELHFSSDLKHEMEMVELNAYIVYE